jgi:2TM domain
MSINEMDEASIRRQIEKRFKERQGFFIHLTAYVLTNLMLWGLWALLTPVSVVTSTPGGIVSQTGGAGFPWPLFVSVGWGIGLVGHLLNYYNKYGGGAERREEAIEREIERYRERNAYEKPKRDENTHLELTEDGEIEEVYEDEPSGARKRG